MPQSSELFYTPQNLGKMFMIPKILTEESKSGFRLWADIAKR